MKVAVLLSGCGVYDGSEIHESVFSLLALAEAGIKAICWFYLYFKSSLIFFSTTVYRAKTTVHYLNSTDPIPLVQNK